MIFGNITVCIIEDFLWFICFWDDTFPGPNCPGPNLPLFQGGQLLLVTHLDDLCYLYLDFCDDISSISEK